MLLIPALTGLVVAGPVVPLWPANKVPPNPTPLNPTPLNPNPLYSIPTQPFPGWPTPGFPDIQPTLAPDGAVTVYRLYGMQGSEPLFTADFNEVLTLVRRGTHRFEGAVFYVWANRQPGMVPLVRGQRKTGTHNLLTQAPGDGTRIEARYGYIPTQAQSGWVALTEWYHPTRDLFLYTTDTNPENPPAVGYQARGVIGYVVPLK
jgi:hypothetical protein